MIKDRNLLKEIKKHLPNKRHTIITGARQVGKTSLLKLLFKQLKTAKEEVFYLSLEDHRILKAVDEHPEKILNFISATPIPILEATVAKRIYLLIDEVQYAKNPTNFLKFFYDTYESNVKVIATGSSAFYIDRKFQDSLAGRKRIFNLYPLSLEEFLSFKGADKLNEEIQLLRTKSTYQTLMLERLTAYFYEYLNYGGYPAVVLENDFTEKRYLLEELKNAYIKRDILESAVEKEGKFYLLLQLLADQIGSLVNKNELANTVQIDGKTIENYLYILQKCYHIQLLRPFYRNVRKELVKMPKVYFNDLGLRNAFLNRFGPINERGDKGALLENYYFLQFRHSYSIDQIKFWRTTDQQEVDFIIEESFGKGKAYELKWTKAAFKANKYRKFSDNYPTFPLECLSADDFYRF